MTLGDQCKLSKLNLVIYNRAIFLLKDDSFQLSFTKVRTPPRGSGHKRKTKPGHSHPDTFKRIKQSVITIKNKDDLCCACAIVTAKFYQHSIWEGCKRGRWIQLQQAQLLHHEGEPPPMLRM